MIRHLLAHSLGIIQTIEDIVVAITQIPFRARERKYRREREAQRRSLADLLGLWESRDASPGFGLVTSTYWEAEVSTSRIWLAIAIIIRMLRLLAEHVIRLSGDDPAVRDAFEAELARVERMTR